jgi:poly(beta-D-mannuronate) lyase
MKKSSIFFCCLLFVSLTRLEAKTWTVASSSALMQADKAAQPGDLILLQKGDWQNANIQLNAMGTADAPITYRVENAGSIWFTGQSSLSIGGSWLIIEGWHFRDGFAGKKAVISFRTSKAQQANHCRVTNSVIDGFNNPKRLDENYWIELHGRNNRIDHCQFRDKQNMGVLLAVILDNDLSRQNFHSIDHNHFGFRIPLASNTGEMIRVGVSEHCEFNSNTQISDNYFDNCDGETEIISIKSGANTIRGNLFKECQGSVVLRHGNKNLVMDNLFLGNGKVGTGGVRIINEGNWVLNNFFYRCRGEGFRAPLCIMNGVPNSPAFRYLPVKDALVANNSFVDCAPMGFCEGSDTERSQAPVNVLMVNNLIHNQTDKSVYSIFDKITGFNFAGNLVNKEQGQQLMAGFAKATLTKSGRDSIIMNKSVYQTTKYWLDSIGKANPERQELVLNSKPGFSSTNLISQLKMLEKEAGTNWYQPSSSTHSLLKIDCGDAASLKKIVQQYQGAHLSINLTGKQYLFDAPINVVQHLELTSKQTTPIQMAITGSSQAFLFQIMSGFSLTLKNISIDLTNLQTSSFISTDSSGSVKPVSFGMYQAKISNSSNVFFDATKTSVADSIIITKSRFELGSGILFKMNQELGKKGYYNVEQLTISNNQFKDYQGQVLDLVRTGNDESTMGPIVKIANNRFDNIQYSTTDKSMIHFAGVQKTLLENNRFKNCYTSKVMILYKDEVKAAHRIKNNTVDNSGKIQTNKFLVTE